MPKLGEAIKKAQEAINTMVAARNYLAILEKGSVGPQGNIPLGTAETQLYIRTIKNLVTDARYKIDELWTILEIN